MDNINKSNTVHQKNDSGSNFNNVNADAISQFFNTFQNCVVYINLPKKEDITPKQHPIEVKPRVINLFTHSFNHPEPTLDARRAKFDTDPVHIYKK